MTRLGAAFRRMVMRFAEAYWARQLRRDEVEPRCPGCEGGRQHRHEVDAA